MIPEFIGRFPVICSTTELNIEQLMKILTEPESALLKQYRFHFALHGIDLQFTDDAIRHIAQVAQERRCGARGLRSIVENVLSDALFELPDLNEKSIPADVNDCNSNSDDCAVTLSATVDLECASKKGCIKYVKSEKKS
jgi:ATP-dependent protease Clp ATPase subunit